jgi:transcriptional regulator with XRE-family HTH domain
MKQETLAAELGGDWTQRKISLLEQKETVEPEILEQVAKVLEVSVSTIKKFKPKDIGNHFNNYGDHYVNQQNDCTFNPLDELLNAFKKNEELYEQLLKVEREKMAMLEKMVGK